MRRREKFANDTKISDPLAYQTSHDPLSVYPAGVRQAPVDEAEDTAAPPEGVKRVSGTCRKCGEYIGRGRAFHERWCGTRDEQKALGNVK